MFKKGVYPTKKDAEEALNEGALYVCEVNGNIAGSIIVDQVQPKEYERIVKYALELAKDHSCRALRLDTGSQNIPAVSLYKKLGFEIVAADSMKVGAAIEHSDHLFLEKIV